MEESRSAPPPIQKLFGDQVCADAAVAPLLPLISEAQAWLTDTNEAYVRRSLLRLLGPILVLWLGQEQASSFRAPATHRLQVDCKCLYVCSDNIDDWVLQTLELFWLSGKLPNPQPDPGQALK